jgi:hypothetical protein
MKAAAAVLALAAGANAWSNVTYVTEVVTALTTYCPVATEITHGGTVYTVTSVRYEIERERARLVGSRGCG